VAASAILVGGDPGIGKSKLLLQGAASFARKGLKCLYISGEEAAAQVRMRAQRLGLSDAPVLLAAETNLRDILTTLDAERPDLAIIDSIQTLWADMVEAAPGAVARPDRRAARRRTYGRLRSLFRGRARPPVPHSACGQEPLRPRR
jgi:DNA repair protein RadA/Sms